MSVIGTRFSLSIPKMSVGAGACWSPGRRTATGMGLTQWPARPLSGLGPRPFVSLSGQQPVQGIAAEVGGVTGAGIVSLVPTVLPQLTARGA